MTSTIYYVATSLDGFIADGEGKLDWLTRFDDAQGVREHYEAFLSGIGALVMGAETYRFLLDAQLPSWPYAGLPCWVFSHRRFAVPEGAQVQFCDGEVSAFYEQIVRSAGAKDVWLMGGGQLAAQFARAGFIDALKVSVVPVVLGRGAPLLPAALPPLELQAITRLGAGLVELAYQVTGAERAASSS